MKSATHTGHCQWCGRPQMLPADLLSKHGYNVRWGFFSGTCNGAGHLPFEKDISLIEGAIKWAEGRIVDLNAEIKDLCTNAKPATVWVHEYTGSLTRSGESYMWRQIERKDLTLGEFGRVSWPAYERIQAHDSRRTGRADTTVYAEGGGSAKSADEAMLVLNRLRAKLVERTVVELKQYVGWQRGRIKGWKPHPDKLVPVVAQRKVPYVHWHGGYFGVGCAGSASGAQKIFNRSKVIGDVTCPKCIKRHTELKAHYEKLDDKVKVEFIKRYGFNA